MFQKISKLLILVGVFSSLAFATDSKPQTVEEEKDEPGILDDLKRGGKRIEKETKRVIQKAKNGADAFDKPVKEESAKKEDQKKTS